MRRDSLHAAAAGLLVALAMSGLAAMSAADDVEVFIQPDIAVIDRCNKSFGIVLGSKHSHIMGATADVDGACG
jgi:hypothetical protein